MTQCQCKNARRWNGIVFMLSTPHRHIAKVQTQLTLSNSLEKSRKTIYFIKFHEVLDITTRRERETKKQHMPYYHFVFCNHYKMKKYTHSEAIYTWKIASICKRYVFIPTLHGVPIHRRNPMSPAFCAFKCEFVCRHTNHTILVVAFVIVVAVLWHRIWFS